MDNFLSMKKINEMKREAPTEKVVKSVFSFEILPKGDIKVKTLGLDLMTIKKEGILHFLSGYLTQKDLERVNSIRVRDTSIDEEDLRVQTLIRTYYAHKRAFYGNKKLIVTEIQRGSQPYKAFARALHIIDTNEVTFDQFMKAQIKGLAFAGAFPKPSQLCTEGAEERVLKTLVVKDAVKDSRVMKLAPDDYNLALNKNNRFQGVYARVIKKEKVSVEELIYCRDVIIARGKKVPDTINLLIEKLRDEE